MNSTAEGAHLRQKSKDIVGAFIKPAIFLRNRNGGHWLSFDITNGPSRCPWKLMTVVLAQEKTTPPEGAPIALLALMDSVTVAGPQKNFQAQWNRQKLLICSL